MLPSLSVGVRKLAAIRNAYDLLLQLALEQSALAVKVSIGAHVSPEVPGQLPVALLEPRYPLIVLALVQLRLRQGPRLVLGSQ